MIRSGFCENCRKRHVMRNPNEPMLCAPCEEYLRKQDGWWDTNPFWESVCLLALHTIIRSAFVYLGYIVVGKAVNLPDIQMVYVLVVLFALHALAPKIFPLKIKSPIKAPVFHKRNVTKEETNAAD